MKTLSLQPLTYWQWHIFHALHTAQVILRDGQTFSSTGPKWKLLSGIKDQVFSSKSHYGLILQRYLQEGIEVQEVREAPRKDFTC